MPLTVRVRARRSCTQDHRLLVVRIYWEDFPSPLRESEHQLDGCSGPLTVEFLEELREPGVYTVMADILPTGEHASFEAEFR